MTSKKIWLFFYSAFLVGYKEFIASNEYLFLFQVIDKVGRVFRLYNWSFWYYERWQQPSSNDTKWKKILDHIKYIFGILWRIYALCLPKCWNMKMFFRKIPAQNPFDIMGILPWKFMVLFNKEQPFYLEPERSVCCDLRFCQLICLLPRKPFMFSRS